MIDCWEARILRGSTGRMHFFRESSTALLELSLLLVLAPRTGPPKSPGTAESPLRSMPLTLGRPLSNTAARLRRRAAQEGMRPQFLEPTIKSPENFKQANQRPSVFLENRARCLTVPCKDPTVFFCQEWTRRLYTFFVYRHPDRKGGWHHGIAQASFLAISRFESRFSDPCSLFCRLWGR